MKKAITSLLFGAALLTACHNPYQSGLDALAEQNFEEARVQARESLNDDPNSPESNLLMAEALMGLEQFRQAEPYASKAFESGGLDARAGRVYGKILWELGMPVEAVDAWRVARAASPDAVSDDDYLRAVETALAMAVHVHDFDRAVVLRDELASLDPDHPDASPEATRKLEEQWAADLVRRGRYEDAVARYRELAKSYPDFADGYWFEIGWHEQQLGRPDAAIEAFERYVQAAPEPRRVGRLLDVARRAERLGATRVARTFYERAIDVTGDTAARADIRLSLAELLLAARDIEGARAQLLAFLDDRAEINGGTVPDDAYESAAERAVNGRAPDIAIAILEQATSIDQPGWRSTQALAELYARRAAVDKVEALLKKYVAGASDSDVARVTAGRWAASRRAFELALFFLEPAAANDDTSAELWLELARIYSALSRVSDVRRALKTYVKKSDGSKNALLSVASIYRAMRLYEDAEDALERAFKEDRTDLSVVRSLESLYDEWRQPAKISAIYDQWIKARGNEGADYQVTGERFYRQGRYAEALDYLETAAKKGENDAYLQIADIHLRQRRERDMKDALDKYLAGATERRAALEAVWQRYRRSGRAIEAVPILEELVELSPDDVRHYDELARLYLELGQDTRAFEMWKRYVESSRDPILALEMMKSRIGGRARSGLMLDFLEDYLARNPNPDPRVYKLMGDAYEAARSRRIGVQADGVFPTLDRAHRYYRLYLEKGSPTDLELRSFANQMQNQGYEDLAVMAYENLDLAGNNNSQALLSYGSALLENGDADLATEVFAQFFERRERSAEAAHQIAVQLERHDRFDALAPYVARIMTANDEGLLTAGFLLGSKALLKTDQIEAIPELAADYLNRTNNPPEARRKVVDFYMNSGLWDEAIRQLEQMNELGSGEHGFEIGRVHFRSGDDDAAEQAFRDWASEHPAPQAAWSQVAEFYQNKGRTELADIAWTQAVNANASNAEVMARRAYFRVVTGRVAEGRADFESARLEANARETGMLWRREAEALQIAGYHSAAAEAAREGLRVALVDRSFFYDIIIDVELSSGDSARIERLIDDVRNSGFALKSLASGLGRHGHIDELVAIIEDQIVNGDPTVGFDLLVEFHEAILASGGTELLTRVSESLLRREQRRRDINGAIGYILAQSGRFAQAAFLYETSEENGFDNANALGRLYLSLGDDARAMRAHQRLLLDSKEEEADATLMELRRWYDLQGRPELFAQLLQRVRDDERFAVAAFRMEVADAILAERPTRAVDLVRSTVVPPTADSVADETDRRHALEKFVAGAEELASAGHARDVVPLLDELPPRVAEEAEIMNLRLRLAAQFDVLPLDAQVAEFTAGHESGIYDDSIRLKLAEYMLTAGRYALAEQLAAPLVESSLPRTAAQALKVVVGSHFGRDDRDAAVSAARAFLDGHRSPMDGRAAAAEALQYVGYDVPALEMRRKSATLAPSSQNVAGEFQAAFFVGDAGEESGLDEWRRFSRVLETNRFSFDPTDSSAQSYLAIADMRRFRLEILTAFEDAPDAYYARLARALLAYLDGEVTFGRELVADILERRSWDPNTVEEVVRHMSQRRIDPDIARVIGKKVDIKTATVPSLRMIGLANHRLGFSEDASRFLDAYVERSSDPVFACSILAQRLNAAGDHAAALEWANRGLALSPTRPDVLLEAGIAGLMTGDTSAPDRLEKAFTSGYRYSEGISRAAHAAAQSGRADLATKYLTRVATHPFTTPRGALEPLMGVAGEEPELATKLLERVYPRIASLDVIHDESFVLPMVTVFQDAGKADAAIETYELALDRAFATGPMNERGQGAPNVWTLQNNLAYVMSEEDVEVERGLALIRQAMAGAVNRRESYIDTLGWLYYRNGDLARAEAEVARATRTAMLNRTISYDPTEFYSHLAELREAQGDQAGSVWYWILVDMLRPE